VNGDLITHTQSSWGSAPSPIADLLFDNFNSVYLSSNGLLEVGIPGSAGFSIAFTNGGDVLNYLPATGAIGVLTSDLLDPSSSSSGAFGGEVVALKINVDYADSGLLPGATGLVSGNLTLCGLASTPSLNGLLVRQFLGVANTVLGGGSASVSLQDAHTVATELTLSFDGGTVSPFAQAHLVNGACP
jgi:hypothetical protein